MRDPRLPSVVTTSNVATLAELELLLHAREDLNHRIGTGAQEPSPDTDKLHEMSICLAHLECEIVRERMRLGSLRR